MATAHSTPKPNDSSGSVSPQPDSPGSQFNIIRVLLTLVIIAVVSGGGYFVWELQSAPPKLVAFTGRVLYKGLPVSVGGVLTELADSALMGAVGALNENGEFTLMTNGEPGAYVGEHKLAVSAMSGGSPPVPIVPGHYTQPSTTPLRLVVTSDPSANRAEFILEESVEEKSNSAVPPQSKLDEQPGRPTSQPGISDPPALKTP